MDTHLLSTELYFSSPFIDIVGNNLALESSQDGGDKS